MAAGYISVYGACIACKQMFAFNPLHVPSVPIEGIREPVCEACMAILNEERRRHGLPAVPIHPAAYEGEPEENVPFEDD